MKKINKNKNPSVPVPWKLYPNSDTYKAQILYENTKKGGIYMWTNLNKW